MIVKPRLELRYQMPLAAVVTICLCISIISLGCGYGEQELEDISRAQASFWNGEAKEVATASLTETTNGVDITLMVTDLPEGEYTLRLHSFGKCDPPHFISAGAILFSSPPGTVDVNWPVFNVSDDRTGHAKLTVRNVTLGLNEELERSLLLRPGGTSLVIHKLRPEGYEAGDEIACGVIRSTNIDQDEATPLDGELESAEHPARLDTPEGKIYRPPEGKTYRSPQGTPIDRP